MGVGGGVYVEERSHLATALGGVAVALWIEMGRLGRARDAVEGHCRFVRDRPGGGGASTGGSGFLSALPVVVLGVWRGGVVAAVDGWVVARVFFDYWGCVVSIAGNMNQQTVLNIPLGFSGYCKPTGSAPCSSVFHNQYGSSGSVHVVWWFIAWQ